MPVNPVNRNLLIWTTSYGYMRFSGPLHAAQRDKARVLSRLRALKWMGRSRWQAGLESPCREPNAYNDAAFVWPHRWSSIRLLRDFPRALDASPQRIHGDTYLQTSWKASAILTESKGAIISEQSCGFIEIGTRPCSPARV